MIGTGEFLVPGFLTLHVIGPKEPTRGWDLRQKELVTDTLGPVATRQHEPYDSLPIYPRLPLSCQITLTPYVSGHVLSLIFSCLVVGKGKKQTQPPLASEQNRFRSAEHQPRSQANFGFRLPSVAASTLRVRVNMTRTIRSITSRSRISDGCSVARVITVGGLF